MQLKLFSWVSIRCIRVKVFSSWEASASLQYRLLSKRVMIKKKRCVTSSFYDDYFLLIWCCSFNKSICQILPNKINEMLENLNQSGGGVREVGWDGVIIICSELRGFGPSCFSSNFSCNCARVSKLCIKAFPKCSHTYPNFPPTRPFVVISAWWEQK